MAKVIVTNDYARTTLLIELEDGSQVEFDVHKGELIDALKNDEQTVIQVNQVQPTEFETLDEKDYIFEILFYDERDEKCRTSAFGNKLITDESLDFALIQLFSNFDFTLIEVRKQGKLLTQDEIDEIRRKYPCEHRFQELHEYFFGKR